MRNYSLFVYLGIYTERQKRNLGRMTCISVRRDSLITANTVKNLGNLPSSTNRDAIACGSDRLSKRRLRTKKISQPQNDLKHTDNERLDEAYLRDVVKEINGMVVF